MAGLRRLLEEDLELEEYTLDSYKKFISQQLDDVGKYVGSLTSKSTSDSLTLCSPSLSYIRY